MNKDATYIHGGGGGGGDAIYIIFIPGFGMLEC